MGTRTNFFRFFGGGTRDRTADLLHAMQALSQLSYTPVERRAHYRDATKSCKAFYRNLCERKLFRHCQLKTLERLISPEKSDDGINGRRLHLTGQQDAQRHG